MGASGKARQNARSRKLAKSAFRLRQRGLTNQEIATQLGLDESVIPARVLLGERLVDAEL